VHELSLCREIASTAARHANGRRVTRVGVRIGYFRQVVPDSLQFCWPFVTEDTGLAGSELDIEHVPAVIECRSCGRTTSLDLPLLLCGTCASRDVVLLSGDEFLVMSITCAKEAS
jgi:hydrogenase nickel incorporation protein HypA/HybF